MVIPNVLANRYAGADLVHLWSPEHKIVLERRLWVAVLRAQKDLGIDVPDGVVDDYEAVLEKVDLDSIAGRERVTLHDVKARIEEFLSLIHISEPTRRTPISYAVFCLKKKKKNTQE